MDGIVMSDVNSNVKTVPCLGTAWDGSHPDCQKCLPKVFDICKIRTQEHKEAKEREAKLEYKKQPLDFVIEALRNRFDYSVKETEKVKAHYFKRDGKKFIIAVSKTDKKVRFQTSKYVKVLSQIKSVQQIESVLRGMSIENK